MVAGGQPRYAWLCVRGKVPVVADPGDQLAADMAGRDRMRASQAGREHAIEVLKAAFVQDRLTKDELDTRVGQAFASRTCAELAALTADLPAGPIAAQPSRPARARGERRILPGTVLAVATVLYAGMWPLAIALPRDWEGEPQAGINLISMTTGLYLLGLILAGRLWLDSRRQWRSRGQQPPRPGRDGRGLQGGRPGSTGREPALPGARPGQTRTDMRTHRPRSGRRHASRRSALAPRGTRPVPGGA
jgi:hypothetical protein